MSAEPQSRCWNMAFLSTPFDVDPHSWGMLPRTRGNDCSRVLRPHKPQGMPLLPAWRHQALLSWSMRGQSSAAETRCP